MSKGCVAALAAFFLFAFRSSAFAADVFCGVDTDFSGTASNPCPEPDKDHDGAPSDGTKSSVIFGAIVDCNDTDFWIRPGFETASGCSAGNYKTCQTSGSYTGCAANSAFTCHSGSGATYFVSAGAADCSGNADYTHPRNWLCFSNTALTGYHAPVAGDCIVFKAGSYSGTWDDSGTTRQFYLNNKDGTSSDNIKIRAEPGAIPGYAGAVVINGAGSAPTAVHQFEITDSNYVKIFGFEVDGTSDYSQVGIIFNGSSGAGDEAYLNYVHNIDGNEDNNIACIECVGTINCSVHNNIVKDCYETGGAGATQQNNMQIRVMDDAGDVGFNYNVVIPTTPVGGGIDCKHAEDTGTFTVRGNFVKNAVQYGIASESKTSTIKNNWITDCDAMAMQYKAIGDANAWFKGSDFSYNTIQRCSLMNMPLPWTDMVGPGPDFVRFHNSCGGADCNTTTGANCCYPNAVGNSATATTLIATIDHNIISDDNASYDGDEGDGMFRICEYNCTLGERAAITNTSHITLTNNVYFSSGTTDLRFGYFGQAGGGADYGTFADWQAAGFDVGSTQADPSLDADGISATYAAYGWSVGLFTDVSSPGSTGTTSGSGSRMLMKRRRK